MRKLKITKYKLVYGNRRFEACKKLGLNKIEAKVRGEENTRLIDLTDIEQDKNIRSRSENEDLSSLMMSIRDKGLLEPIGVCTEGSMSEQEFLLINASENLHREDVTPTELGKVCKELVEKHNMNIAEIGVKLNLPKSKVEKYIRIYREIPVEFHNMIGTMKHSMIRNGKVTPTLVHQILNCRLTKVQTEALLNHAKRNDMTSSQIRLVKQLIEQGNSFTDAIKNYKSFLMHKNDFALNREMAESLMKEFKLKNKSQLVTQILAGKIRGKPELVQVF